MISNSKINERRREEPLPLTFLRKNRREKNMFTLKIRNMRTVIAPLTIPLQLIVALSLSILTGVANADIDTLWARWYEGSAIRSVHQLPDGGYIFVVAEGIKAVENNRARCKPDLPNPFSISRSDFHCGRRKDSAVNNNRGHFHHRRHNFTKTLRVSGGKSCYVRVVLAGS